MSGIENALLLIFIGMFVIDKFPWMAWKLRTAMGITHGFKRDVEKHFQELSAEKKFIAQLDEAKWLKTTS